MPRDPWTKDDLKLFGRALTKFFVLVVFGLLAVAALFFLVESSRGLGDIEESLPVSVGAAFILLSVIGIFDPFIWLRDRLPEARIRKLLVINVAITGLAILFSFFGPKGLVWRTSNIWVWLVAMGCIWMWLIITIEAYGERIFSNRWESWNESPPAFVEHWEQYFWLFAMACLVVAYNSGRIG